MSSRVTFGKQFLVAVGVEVKSITGVPGVLGAGLSVMLSSSLTLKKKRKLSFIAFKTYFLRPYN